MSKTAIDAKRGTIFIMAPEDLTLIRDKKHPLYDERVELPPDESIVLNMMAKGVRVPIKARKNGEALEVVDGRRRVINATEANKRLKAEGAEPLAIKVEVERGQDNDLIDTMVLCNELRRSDDPVTKAKKVQRYLDSGRTLDEAALMWGVTTNSIRNWLKIHDLHPDVQSAVKKGQMGQVEATAEFATLPREEQATKIAGMELPAPTPSGKARRKKRGKKVHKRPTPKFIRLVAEASSPTIKEALLWAIGDLKTVETTAKLNEIITSTKE